MSWISHERAGCVETAAWVPGACDRIWSMSVKKHRHDLPSRQTSVGGQRVEVFFEFLR